MGGRLSINAATGKHLVKTHGESSSKHKHKHKLVEQQLSICATQNPTTFPTVGPTTNWLHLHHLTCVSQHFSGALLSGYKIAIRHPGRAIDGEESKAQIAN